MRDCWGGMRAWPSECAQPSPTKHVPTPIVYNEWDQYPTLPPLSNANLNGWGRGSGTSICSCLRASSSPSSMLPILCLEGALPTCMGQFDGCLLLIHLKSRNDED